LALTRGTRFSELSLISFEVIATWSVFCGEKESVGILSFIDDVLLAINFVGNVPVVPL
jgi:hypothetical protein